VQLLATHGRITTAATSTDSRAAMVNDWLAARQSGDDVIMLATRRHDVDQLNRAARHALVTSGAVRSEGTEVRGREFAVGDRVMTLSNWHRHGITNGARGTITELIGQTPTIAFDDGQTRSLPSSYLRAGHLTHAYAMTIHKAQGATVDRALILGDDALFKEAGYTGLSRGRDENRLYVAIDQDRDDAAHHHASQAAAPLEDLTRALDDSHAKELAIETADLDLALEL